MAIRFRTPTHVLTDGSNLAGDGDLLGAAQVGGNDKFLGESGAPNGYTAFGDARTMSGHAKGGSDYLKAGDNVHGVNFSGDGGDLQEFALGGNDTLLGGENSTFQFFGDASGSMSGQARGGNDSIVGSSAYGNDGYSVIQGIAFGDSLNQYGASHGGADFLSAGAVTADPGGSLFVLNEFAGDSYNMYDSSTGGNDKLIGGTTSAYESGQAMSLNVFCGDGYHMNDGTTGGNDTLVGGNAYHGDSSSGQAVALNILSGDGYTAWGGVKFGADVITGGSGTGDHVSVLNVIFGDALGYTPYNNDASPHSLSGDALAAAVSSFSAENAGGGLPTFADMVAAVNHQLSMSSDPLLSTSTANPVVMFGNDKLFGGAQNAQNVLYGDTSHIYANGYGGNDTLIGGGAGTTNILVGDADNIDAGGFGGKDRLVSGEGNDEMWGDAKVNMLGMGGADTFVFARNNGNDVIHDFQVGVDHIDLSAFLNVRGMSHTFSALVSSGRLQNVNNPAVGANEQINSGNVILHLDADPASNHNTVLILGVTLDQLSGSSFIFFAVPGI